MGTTKGQILEIIAGDPQNSTSIDKKQTERQVKQHTAEVSANNNAIKTWKNIFHKKEMGVFFALIAVLVGFAIFIPSFMTGQNVAVILKQMSILALLTYGMTFVFCAGEVDLSVGMVLNSSMAFMAILMTQYGWNSWAAVAAGLIFSVVLGAVNGMLAVAFRLSTIVVTLGTMSIYRGIALLINGGRTISGLPDGSFLLMGRLRIFGISLIVWISLAIFIILLFIFKNTKFSRHLILMGDNMQAAEKMGINTKRLRVAVMAFSGLLSGIGGVLTLSNLTSADTTTGSDYAMSAIGAVVIGGTKMGGGAGTMWGSLIGIILVTVIQNGLVFLGLQSGWRSLFIGVTMIAAIFIDTMVERRSAYRYQNVS